MMSTAPRKPRRRGRAATHPKLTTGSRDADGKHHEHGPVPSPGDVSCARRTSRERPDDPRTQPSPPPRVAPCSRAAGGEVAEDEPAEAVLSSEADRMGLEEEEDEGEGEQDRHADGEDEDRRGRALERRLRRDPGLEQRLTSTTAISARRPAGVRTHRSWASWRSATALDPSPSSLSETGPGQAGRAGSPPAPWSPPEPMAYSKLSLWAMIS